MVHISQIIQDGGFEYEGVWISDPSYDETGRFKVNPAQYYKIKID
jgi:hypothetical protein